MEGKTFSKNVDPCDDEDEFDPERWFEWYEENCDFDSIKWPDRFIQRRNWEEVWAWAMLHDDEVLDPQWRAKVDECCRLAAEHGIVEAREYLEYLEME